MKRNELRKLTTEELAKKIKESNKEQREKINDFIKKCIMFSPNDLSKLLTVLLFAKEQKVYIPIISSYTVAEKAYDFYALAPSDIVCSTHCESNVIKDKSTIILYKGKWSYLKPNYDNEMVTYQFILDNYGIDVDETECITKYNFDGYEYVKDFINYLIQKRIVKNGYRLNNTELYHALHDFMYYRDNIELKRTKPSTRILNKKD